MAFEIILLLVGLVIGFFIAYIIYSQQKWSDKSEALNARWEQKLNGLEKDNEVDKERWEKKYGNLEKEWKIRYIKDIEELKRLFKESEKVIRTKSVSSSRRSLVGKFIERFVPFLSKIKYAPSDMHFLGQPIDYIVFEGLGEDDVKKVVFLEVKTGDSKLTKREKSLMDAIKKKKVEWEEVRVDTKSKGTPDKEMTSDEETVKGLYEDIDRKLKSVKKGFSDENEETEGDEEEVEPSDEESEYESEEYDVICPKCEENFTIESEEGDNLEEGINVRCPHCKKMVNITEEDVV